MTVQVRSTSSSMFFNRAGGQCSRGCGRTATTLVHWLRYRIGDYCCPQCARQLHSLTPRLTWQPPHRQLVKGD
jgi:hypothetical protein